MEAMRPKAPWIWVLVLGVLAACGNEATAPKPRGYFRIHFPEKSYQLWEPECPFRVEIPTYARISKDESREAEPCWFNIEFPEFHATLHLSYKPVADNDERFRMLTEDARTFVYKHVVKAERISEKIISYPDQSKFGLDYFIGGNAASNRQFYITDTLEHFIRGALYFRAEPNIDSLGPVLEFLGKDVDRIISSLEWR